MEVQPPGSCSGSQADTSLPARMISKSAFYEPDSLGKTPPLARNATPSTDSSSELPHATAVASQPSPSTSTQISGLPPSPQSQRQSQSDLTDSNIMADLDDILRRISELALRVDKLEDICKLNAQYVLDRPNRQFVIFIVL